MQNIGCTIDTKPMAAELANVTRHVQGTTTAVVAMQAAVIQAERQAADRVCSDVNKGFHALMSSQISQKIAKLQSEVDSHLMRLNQQVKQLLAIKTQMERDYQRTAQRYGKTFSMLNKELRQRVQELDQPIFKFATTEVQVTSNRMSALSATIPVGQLESVADAQRILTSNVKYHGKQVLEASRDFVASMNEQEALTERILLSNQKAESATRYIPVCMFESVYAEGNSCSVYASRDVLGAANLSDVKGLAMQQMSDLQWHEASEEREVDNEMVKLLANSNCPERVKKTIHQLFINAEKYQTL